MYKTFSAFSGRYFRILLSLVIFGLAFFGCHQQVFAATLTLTPATGVAGQEVIVTGASFDNSSVVTFTWDGAPLTTVPAVVTTSAAGAIPAAGNVSFTVPSGAYGAHTVRASTGTNVIAVATYTISTPTVAITSPTVPTAGLPPGVTLTVTAAGLEANKLTTFMFDDTTMTTSTSTVNGTAQAVFAIPEGNNTGVHIIKASNSAYAVASTTITVAAPAITLTPATTQVGTQVSLVGTNFAANTAVTFYLNGSTLTPAASVTSNGAGSFATSFTVPELVAGAHTVKAQTSTSLFAVATLTVSAPAITVTPATTAPGTQVTVTGTNFTANSAISFFLNGETLTPTSTVTTNSLGSFTATFTLPLSAAGANIIKAQASSTVYGTATVTISAPAIVLSPITGPDNLSVFVNGTGFKANATVNFYVNGSQLGDTVTSNSLGSFGKSVSLPIGLPAGAQTVRAQTDALNFANATYTVVGPTVVVSPTAGTPGTRVTLTGLNFNPDASVVIKWNGTEIKPQEESLKSTSSGGFYANITIPDDYGSGTSQIEVSTSSKNTVLTSFIVSTPTLTLAPTSGYPGSKISVTGANFEGNKKLELRWDDQIIATTPSTVTTTPLGGFTAVITVPPTSRGTHAITASAGDKVINFSAIFTVNTPTVTVATTTQANTKLAISGTGFPPKGEVTFLWDGDIMVETESERVRADANGYFNDFITIPENTSTGIHTLKATASNSINVDTSITITTGTISLSRTNGPSLSKITITGTSFDSNKHLDFWWDGTAMKTESITSDGIGGFSTSFTLPLSSPGIHTLKVGTSEFGVAATDFTIDTPSLSVQTEKARIGTDVTLQGNSFAVGRDITIEVNGRRVKIDPDKVTTDGQGNFSARIRIPFTFGTKVHITASTADEDRTTLSYEINQDVVLQYIGMYGIYVLLVVAVLALGGLAFHFRKKILGLKFLHLARFTKPTPKR